MNQEVVLFDTRLFFEETLLALRHLPALLLNSKEEARLANSCRIEKSHFDAKIEAALTTFELDSSRNFLILDFNHAPHIGNSVNRLVLDYGFFLKITILSIALVQLNRWQMQEQCLEIKRSNQMELGPRKVFLVEAKVLPDVRVRKPCLAKNFLFLVLSQAQGVQGLALDDQALIFTFVSDAPELHFEFVIVLGVHRPLEAQLVNKASLFIG